MCVQVCARSCAPSNIFLVLFCSPECRELIGSRPGLLILINKTSWVRNSHQPEPASALQPTPSILLLHLSTAPTHLSHKWGGLWSADSFLSKTQPWRSKRQGGSGDIKGAQGIKQKMRGKENVGACVSLLDTDGSHPSQKKSRWWKREDDWETHRKVKGLRQMYSPCDQCDQSRNEKQTRGHRWRRSIQMCSTLGSDLLMYCVVIVFLQNT